MLTGFYIHAVTAAPRLLHLLYPSAQPHHLLHPYLYLYVHPLNCIIFQSAIIFPATFPPSGQFASFLLSGEEVPQLSVLIDLGAARPLKANEKRKQWWELCFDFQTRSPSSASFQLLTPSLCFEIWFHHNSRRKTLNLSYLF